jgi:hypothetical protein
MNTDINEIESIRTLSLLSGSQHHIKYQGKHHVVYAGYVLPYRTFSSLFRWAVCGPQMYHMVWCDNLNDADAVLSLNPQDEKMAYLDRERIGHYVSSIFKQALENLEQNDLEYLLEDMLSRARLDDEVLSLINN